MVLLIGGVILTVLMLLDNETVKNITLDKDGHADEELTFYAREINPGESRDYTVVLHGGNGELLDVTLVFDDAKGILAEYLEVDISCHEYSKHAKLTEILGEENTFTCKFDDEYRIEIVYTLPIAADNKVMGTEANFVLSLQTNRN